MKQAGKQAKKLLQTLFTHAVQLIKDLPKTQEKEKEREVEIVKAYPLPRTFFSLSPFFFHNKKKKKKPFLFSMDRKPYCPSQEASGLFLNPFKLPFLNFLFCSLFLVLFCFVLFLKYHA